MAESNGVVNYGNKKYEAQYRGKRLGVYDTREEAERAVRQAVNREMARKYRSETRGRRDPWQSPKTMREHP